MKRLMILGYLLAVSIHGLGGCGEAPEPTTLEKESAPLTEPGAVAVKVAKGEYVEGAVNSTTWKVDQGDQSTFEAGNHSTIGGGLTNKVRYNEVGGGNSDYATIGGGTENTVSSHFATVAGGGSNTARSYASTVGGGDENSALDDYATVGGGVQNAASGNFATIAGGYQNATNFQLATVGGGTQNSASNNGATVGGGQENTAGGVMATVGGGTLNIGGGDYATVGGGYQNAATKLGATVAGGHTNTASGQMATVSGGYKNISSGYGATTVGGYSNSALGDYSFAAGVRAKASHNGAFVWADSTDADFTSTVPNQFAVRAGGGIYFNAPSIQLGASATSGYVLKANSTGVGTWQAETGDISEVKTGIGLTSSSGTGPIPTVSLKSCTSTNQILKWTGSDWTCQSDADSGGDILGVAAGAGLAGGGTSGTPTLSIASSYSLPQTCTSGQLPSWNGSIWSCVSASSSGISSVSGTSGITASTNSGAVSLSLASPYALPQSCADGSLPVKAGTTWGCSSSVSNANGYTLKRSNGDLLFGADGSITLYTNASRTTGISVASGGSMVRSLSDRNAKTALRKVEVQALLEKVGALELTTWQYKDQPGGVRHIGPMAQDFHLAFELGEDDTHIGTVDADGVALAAIQGLLERSKAQDARLNQQQAQLAALESENARLKHALAARTHQTEAQEARLTRLEQQANATPVHRDSPLRSLPAGAGWAVGGVGALALMWQTIRFNFSRKWLRLGR